MNSLRTRRNSFNVIINFIILLLLPYIIIILTVVKLYGINNLACAIVIIAMVNIVIFIANPCRSIILRSYLDSSTVDLVYTIYN